MPPLSGKELERRLDEAGNNFLRPPSSVDELLPLLDRTLKLLSKVEQAPAKPIQAALSPLTNALVTEVLMKHSNIDVKVGVASCISEITRITAPYAPYGDDQMKDVFQLTVSSLENISDTSRRSHEKRATILETLAKIRSCIIMLDLDCEDLIIEMFQLFLKDIRHYHRKGIFASMETIMTLIIEESEDLPLDLLKTILSTLKKDNETVLPIAKKLAERVVRNCAEKLELYLTQALTLLDTTLDDYSEVIASVCEANNDISEHSNENICKDLRVALVGKEETHPQDGDVPVNNRSPKSTVSNEMGNEETMTDAIVNEIATEETVTDANNLKELEANVEHASKRKGRQLNFKNDSADSSDLHDDANQAEQVPNEQEPPLEVVHSSPMDVLPVEASKFSDESKDTSIQLSPSEAPKDEDFIVASPDQNGSLSSKNRSKNFSGGNRNGSLVKKMEISVETASKKASVGTKYSDAEKQDNTAKDKAFREEDAFRNDSGSTSDTESRSLDKLKEACIQLSPSEAPKKVYFSVLSTYQSGEENQSKRSGWERRNRISAMKGKIFVDTASKKASEGTKNSEAKKQQHSVKKKPVETDGSSRSDTESRSLNRTEKPDDATNEMDDEFPSRNEDIKKSGKIKKSFERDHGKDMVTSPRSPLLKSTKNEDSREETPKTSTKRKRTPGTDKASEIKYGRNLVDSKVRVWWPDDQMFYNGVIASYDYIKKKHTVLYNDGDEEVLNLRKERWEFVKTLNTSGGIGMTKSGSSNGKSKSTDSIKVSEMAKRKTLDKGMSRESEKNSGKK